MAWRPGAGMGRRPAAPRPKRRRKRDRARWALAALLALIIGEVLVVRSCREEAVVPPPPAEQAKGGGLAGPKPPPLPPLVKPPPPKPPETWNPDRQRLRDALMARASELSACTLPPGAPTRMLTRIRVAKAGPVRAVSFANADPIPRGLQECLRGRMLAWDFKELQLSTDVEVLVTFNLGAQ